MKIQLDPDVEKVMEFMARELPAEKLIPVARSIAQLAELAWNFPTEPSNTVHLSEWPGFPLKATNADRSRPER
jgi:hypothetical protein